jgi:hypothetical protein
MRLSQKFDYFNMFYVQVGYKIPALSSRHVSEEGKLE